MSSLNLIFGGRGRRSQGAALLGRAEGGVRGAGREHRGAAVHQSTQCVDRLDPRGGEPAGVGGTSQSMRFLPSSGLLLRSVIKNHLSLRGWPPGGPLGPAVPRDPARSGRPPGGPVRLGGAAQLRAALPAEEDEHQQPGLRRGRLLPHHIRPTGG